MVNERALRLDADEIAGVPLCPEGTPLSPELRTAIRNALIAQIIADRLIEKANQLDKIFSERLHQAIDVAGVLQWDDPSITLPMWEEPLDELDIFEGILSATAAEELQALYQLVDGNSLGSEIANGLVLAPNEREIVMAQTILEATTKPPIEY